MTYWQAWCKLQVRLLDCGKTQTRDRRWTDATRLRFSPDDASPRQDVRISSPPSRRYGSSKTHSVRVEFTRQHDNYLVKYLATYSPSKEGRSGNIPFRRLVANVRPFVSLFCTDSDRSCRKRGTGRGPYTIRGSLGASVMSRTRTISTGSY